MSLPQPLDYTVSGDDNYILHGPNGARIPYKKYDYTPLSTERSIRLLKPNFDLRNPLHRSQGRFNHFLIEEHSLDDPNLKYVPISYVWGPAGNEVPLTLGSEADGSVCLVTPTAWQAIQKMCFFFPLWIDQICINQKDKVEIGVQIGLMGEIYSSPRRFTTVVWLGAADHETKAAFDFVETLTTAFPLDREFPIHPDDAFHQPHDWIRTAIQSTYPDYAPPADDDPGWACLAKILGRTWFSRTWTFQEVVLSPDLSINVVCARWDLMCTTTLQKLYRASILLGSYNVPHYNTAVLAGRTALRAVILARHELSTGLPVPLSALLNLTDSRECREPRDKIYALLNCQSHDPTRVTIKVDLDKSDQEIYADATRKIIASESSLLISLTASGRQNGRVSQLPSWVPDYTANVVARCMEALNPNRPLFSASRGRRLGETDRMFIGDQLVVQGCTVDKVTEVISSDIPDNATNDEIYSHLREWLPRFLHQLNTSSDETDAIHTMHRIARTVILDNRDADLYQFRRFSFASRRPSHPTTTTSPPPEDRTLADQETEDNTMLRLLFATPSSAAPAVSPPEERQRRWNHDFAKQAANCKGRRFALLEKHGFGLVPRHTEIGDIVTVLHGSSVPVVLRASTQDVGKFQLVGPCFVDGIMRGEAVDWTRDSVCSYTLV